MKKRLLKILLIPTLVIIITLIILIVIINIPYWLITGKNILKVPMKIDGKIIDFMYI